MICKNCGKPTAYNTVITRTYGKGDDLLVIEDVPVISCRNCGIDLISAETFHALNKLRTSAEVRAAKRLVAVVGYNEAVAEVASKDKIEESSVAVA
jgi:YgiT-type zinc finger domain-containing protein